jgi:hypothetical protein
MQKTLRAENVYLELPLWIYFFYKKRLKFYRKWNHVVDGGTE